MGLNYIYLVISSHPSEKYDESSVGMMTFIDIPNAQYMEKSTMFQTTNQFMINIDSTTHQSIAKQL